MKNWHQTPAWEELFQTVIIKAKDCPALALCNNDYITANQVSNAAGNHVFDDYPDFWGITQNQGHELRAVFQYHSTSQDAEFCAYIQQLIDSAMDLKFRRLREKLE